MSDDKNHECDDTQVHDPMHRKHGEEQPSSSERQRDHQDKEGSEIESHLKDQGSVFIISEDGSHPKDHIERQ